MGNGGEPVIAPEKLGDLGRSKGGSDNDGYETGSLEWFGHVKRRGETENIHAVAEMKMEESALGEDQSSGGTILSEGT